MFSPKSNQSESKMVFNAPVSKKSSEKAMRDKFETPERTSVIISKQEEEQLRKNVIKRFESKDVISKKFDEVEA